MRTNIAESFPCWAGRPEGVKRFGMWEIDYNNGPLRCEGVGKETGRKEVGREAGGDMDGSVS